MTERVVITGLGVVSCLGNEAAAVKDALFNGRSGISLRQDHVDAGMRSQIAGTPDIDLSEHIDRKQWRFMGDAAGYAYLSLQQAIAHAGLSDAESLTPAPGLSPAPAAPLQPVRWRPPIFCATGYPSRGAVPGDPDHGQYSLSLSRTVSDKGVNIRSLRLFNQRALHWSRDGTHSVG